MKMEAPGTVIVARIWAKMAIGVAGPSWEAVAQMAPRSGKKLYVKSSVYICCDAMFHFGMHSAFISFHC